MVKEEDFHISQPDICTIASLRIREIWIKRGIWDPEWGDLPGMRWANELPVDRDNHPAQRNYQNEGSSRRSTGPQPPPIRASQTLKYPNPPTKSHPANVIPFEAQSAPVPEVGRAKPDASWTSGPLSNQRPPLPSRPRWDDQSYNMHNYPQPMHTESSIPIHLSRPPGIQTESEFIARGKAAMKSAVKPTHNLNSQEPDQSRERELGKSMRSTLNSDELPKAGDQPKKRVSATQEKRRRRWRGSKKTVGEDSQQAPKAREE